MRPNTETQNFTLTPRVIQQQQPTIYPRFVRQHIAYQDRYSAEELSFSDIERRTAILEKLQQAVQTYIKQFGMYHAIDEEGAITIIAQGDHPGLKLYMEQSVEYNILHNKRLQQILSRTNKQRKKRLPVLSCSQSNNSKVIPPDQEANSDTQTNNKSIIERLLELITPYYVKRS